MSIAKKPKKTLESWVKGFELREQFPSGGDYQFIKSKMLKTLEPKLTGQLYSGYEILQVSLSLMTFKLLL
jgi:hypothetical protein